MPLSERTHQTPSSTQTQHGWWNRSHKESIQYPGRLQISKKTAGIPIKVHIEWAQKRYKRGTYSTINGIQWPGEKQVYIGISELNKVHTNIDPYTTHFRSHNEALSANSIHWLYHQKLYGQHHTNDHSKRTLFLTLRVQRWANADLSGRI